MSDDKARARERVYELVADIAQGGMGRVELVVRREGSFARIYAMKRLRPELSEDLEVRRMFLEEARIAGLIRHPNVVPVLDVGEDELGPYLVMDYVEGVAAYKPLTAARASGRKLSVAFCVEVARQTAHGLAAAHELEGAGGQKLCVVHRDVSPQNILLGFDGLVRVTDFGVARALDKHLDEEGVIKGKIGYMSPEQITGRPLDGRSDLFSFGIVLYELLAGARLYAGPQEEIFDRIRAEPPPDIRAVRRDVPEPLGELLLELLAKSPEDRPTSAAIVAERLERIGAALRDDGDEESLPRVLRQSFAEERERQRALAAAALERTRAEISLFDAADGPPLDDANATVPARPTPARGARRDTLETTPALGPKAVARDVHDGHFQTVMEPRRARRPSRRALAIGLGAVGAAALAAGLVWASAALEGDDDAPASTTAAAALGCADSEACRIAHGPPFFCDPDTGRCESPVSDVCPATFPADPPADPDAIVFGTILDRSTPNQLAREKAAHLAVTGLNRAGGIDGRPVMLVHCDTSVADATEAADRLVRAGVSAIIGPSSSSDTAAVFSSHAADGLLVVSPSSTATQLAGMDANRAGLLWRTAPPDTLQAAVILSQVRQPPAASSLVVVRRSNDVYAQSLSVILQERAAAQGLGVARSQVFSDAAGIGAAARAAGASSPDAVVFVSSHVADAAAFLDATADVRGYDGATIYLADASANDDLVALTTSGWRRFHQVRATRPAPPSTIITSEFVSEYMSANDGQDPLSFSFTAHAYDATALVLLGAGYALRDGGALTGPRIAEGIERMSAGSREHRLLRGSFPAIIAALRAEPSDVNVVGASGPLDFDPATGELTSATYEVLGIRGNPPRLEVLATVHAPP